MCERGIAWNRSYFRHVVMHSPIISKCITILMQELYHWHYANFQLLGLRQFLRNVPLFILCLAQIPQFTPHPLPIVSSFVVPLIINTRRLTLCYTEPLLEVHSPGQATLDICEILKLVNRLMSYSCLSYWAFNKDKNRQHKQGPPHCSYAMPLSTSTIVFGATVLSSLRTPSETSSIHT